MNTKPGRDALGEGRSSIGRCFSGNRAKPRKVKVDPEKREKDIIRDMLECGEICGKRAQIMLRKITLRYSEMATGVHHGI